MVNQLVSKLVMQQKVNAAADVIRDYREQSEALQQQELQDALLRIQANENTEQVLKEFAHRLTQKLLHPTSILLRQAAQDDNPSQMDWLRETLPEIMHKRRKPKQSK